MMGPMDLSTLVLNDIEHRLGSLTLSLVALLRWAGGNVRYRSLNAALGLSLRITALRRRTCLAWWSTHGCDTYLDSTAQMFGMRLRELHPPEAAVGLSEHPPFDQHFQASYAPLIRTALEHNQPVLAWQGWPDVRRFLWGIITRTWEEGVGFAGTTMWSHGQIVPLVAPPVQFYVLEEILPRKPRDEELMKTAVFRFRQVLCDSHEADPDVMTGPEAYEPWLDRLKLPDVCPTCGVAEGRCHLQHARCVVSARSSAVRFFQHYRDGADRSLRPLIDALLAECRGSMDALATSRDQAAVKVLIQTPEGRKALAAGVKAAQSFDRAMVDAINQLAERLRIAD